MAPDFLSFYKALMMILASVLLSFMGAVVAKEANSTYSNPIIPGFHPDPSCIFVPDWNNTYFCASSSFNAFPGIPIHASRDLRNWQLIGNAISRPEMLPKLATTVKSTSGIWAPTLRYREEQDSCNGEKKGTFWISTTLVFDNLAANDSSRWDNFVISTQDPFNSSSWSDPVHFTFGGYDTSLFWDDDGKVYVSGSHEYKVWPGIQTAPINLQNGHTGPWSNPWNGTGELAPEGPHIYKKDGYYYLLIAEGGTGSGHKVTMARSTSINGYYEPAPQNPLLTAVDSDNFFQTVGHADLFHDANGNWWAVALSTRAGPELANYPMGRETVMTPVTWNKGDWPNFDPVRGVQTGWELPSAETILFGTNVPYGDTSEHLNFPRNSELPFDLIHWRLPKPDAYLISPPGYDNSLVLKSSVLNLTSLDGISARGQGQTFIGRRQTDNMFTYRLDIDASALSEEEDEVGVSVFLVQTYHFDLGVVMLSTSNAMNASTRPRPFFRFRGISGTSVPDVIFPFPSYMSLETPITIEVKAFNWTHYSFAAGPRNAQHLMTTYGSARGEQLSYGFTGTLVGPYATSNGRIGSLDGAFQVAVGNWSYLPQGQVIN